MRIHINSAGRIFGGGTVGEIMPSDLILAIQARAGNSAPPPLSEAEIRDAEDKLGFRLPDLLRELYTEIGNGGFGPGQGLMRLKDLRPGEQSAVDSYIANHQEYPDMPNWKWPTGVLQICDWGCNNYSCVDCIAPPNPVLTFEPGGIDEPMEQSFVKTRDSLESWLRDWLSGIEVYDTLYEPAPELDRVGKNPKTGEPMVLKAKKRKRHISYWNRDARS
jgi:hypothetical protein